MTIRPLTPCADHARPTRRLVSAVVALAVGLAVLAAVPDAAGAASTAPVTAVATRPDGSGWWTVTAAGAVRNGDGARHFGSLAGRRLN
ncbi:MAG TPA: hypothetical protein VMQ81_11925, partial [Acidimicrobiia bacterium]|nr:hypothetical protein [Acidimicrobiia bacterium]